MPSIRVLDLRRRDKREGGNVPEKISWFTGTNGIRCGQVPGLPIVFALVYSYGDLDDAIVDLSSALSKQVRGNGILLTKSEARVPLSRRYSASSLAGKHITVRLVDEPEEAALKLAKSFADSASKAQQELANFSAKMVAERESAVQARTKRTRQVHQHVLEG